MDSTTQRTSDEIMGVLSWFQDWKSNQKETFLRLLLAKAVPDKLCVIVDALGTLNVDDPNGSPDTFTCQLNLFKQWFDKWTCNEKNEFLSALETIDSEFVCSFNEQVRRTCGEI